jgi:uncharacterized protein
MRNLVASVMLMTVFPVSLAYAGSYAPLDCSKANRPAEQTICRNYALGQQEARMATLFAVATSLVAMGQRGNIQDAQRAWLEKRNACGTDAACVAQAYKGRINELSGVIDQIAARGPF